MPTNQNNKRQPWRPAVQAAMREASDQEALARYGTSTPAFNYRWEHVTAVVTLALKLAELTGADKDIVEAAAWLHDVRKDTQDNHPLAGAKFAKKILAKTDFPDEKIDGVAGAIEAHMGLWRDFPLENLESQVLWDADKLTKIGLTAAFHWLGNVMVKNKKSWSTEDLITFGRAPEWQERTVASMHTKPARRAARKRLKNYYKLWDSLAVELIGADLK